MSLGTYAVYACIALGIFAIAGKKIWDHYRLLAVGIELTARIDHFEKEFERSYKKSRGSDYPNYHPVLSFFHNGQKFQVKELTRGASDAIFPGEELTVMVDPAHPERAIRKDGVSAPSGPFFIVFLTVLAGFILYARATGLVVEVHSVFIYGGVLILLIGLSRMAWVMKGQNSRTRVHATTMDMEFPVQNRSVGHERTVGPEALRVFRYRLGDREVTALALSMARFAPSHSCYLYVNPKQPRDYIIDEPGELWLLPGVLGLIGLVAVLMGFLFRHLMV